MFCVILIKLNNLKQMLQFVSTPSTNIQYFAWQPLLRFNNNRHAKALFNGSSFSYFKRCHQKTLKKLKKRIKDTSQRSGTRQGQFCSKLSESRKKKKPQKAANSIFFRTTYLMRRRP